MKSLLAFTTATLAASAVPSLTDLDQLTAYTFETYVSEFNKAYATSSLEYQARKAKFEVNKLDIIAHNQDKSNTWFKTINQFSDMDSVEFSNSHGFVHSRGVKTPTYLSSKELNIPADFRLSSLPKTVDWRTGAKNPRGGDFVTPVKNQGMCGSCWAFSSTENIESHVALDANLTTPIVLSPQNLVSCDPNPKHCGGKGGCLGSVPELAFDWVKTNGLASEQDWPYVSGHTSINEACNNTAKPAAHITGYVKLSANNYTEVMYTLANIGPVAVNVDAIPMQSYGGGLMTGCALDDTHIDHVVQLVGFGYDSDFDKNYWIMRNSWGTTWGIDGYMHLLRREPSENWCSLDIYPLDGTGCDGGPGTLNVCGSCGVLFDVSYPIGGSVGGSVAKEE